jgi:hypothetical protein
MRAAITVTAREMEVKAYRNAAVNEVIRDLLVEVDAHIGVVSLWNKANDAAVQACVVDILEAFDAYELSLEHLSPSVLTCETWLPDVEPTPSEPDSWIRGAVPRRPCSLPVTPPEAPTSARQSGGPIVLSDILVTKVCHQLHTTTLSSRFAGVPGSSGRPTGTPVSKQDSRPHSALSISQTPVKRPASISFPRPVDALQSIPSTGGTLTKKISTQVIISTPTPRILWDSLIPREQALRGEGDFSQLSWSHSSWAHPALCIL